MADRAVDLGWLKDKAQTDELRQLYLTREAALRRQVALEAENDALLRLLATLTRLGGDPDGQGKVVWVITPGQAAETQSEIAAFSLDETDGILHLVVTLAE